MSTFDLERVTTLTAPHKSPSQQPPVVVSSGFHNPLSVVAAELDNRYRVTERYLKYDEHRLAVQEEQEFIYAELGASQWAEYLQYRFSVAIGYVEQPPSYLDNERLVPLKELQSLDLVVGHLNDDIRRPITKLGREGILIVDCGTTLDPSVVGTIYVITNLFKSYKIVEMSSQPGNYYLICRNRQPVAWIATLPVWFSYEWVDNSPLTEVEVPEKTTTDPRLNYRRIIDWNIPSGAPDHLPPPIECQPRGEHRGGGRGRGGEGRGRGGERRGGGRGRGGEGRGRGGEGRGRGGERRGGGRGRGNH